MSAAALGSTSAAGAQGSDTTKSPGTPSSELGERFPHERPERLSTFRGRSSRTPLQDLHGTITPADLHFERHHGGIPEIDPVDYRLLIHGMVERQTMFAMDDLKRF